jgi:hypothetical protein
MLEEVLEALQEVLVVGAVVVVEETEVPHQVLMETLLQALREQMVVAAVAVAVLQVWVEALVVKAETAL